MLVLIVQKTVLQHLKSLAFTIGILVMLAAFTASTASWLITKREESEQLNLRIQNARDDLTARAEKGLFFLAFGTQAISYGSPLGFVSGGLRGTMANSANVGLSEVTDIVRIGRRNPLLPFVWFDWVYIVGTLGTLLALVLSHDLISGERERGTLPLLMANPVPRDVVLFGKFLGTFFVVSAPMLLGSIGSLIAISLYTPISFSVSTVVGFGFSVVSGLLCVSVFLWLGLFASCRARSSSSGLFGSMVVWWLLSMIVPSVGGHLGRSLVDVPSVLELRRQVAVDGMVMRETEQAGGGIYEAYWNGLADQIGKAQRLIQVSPVNAFRYIADALCDTGVLRLRHFLKSVQSYRTEFAEFVARVDKGASDSTHKLVPGRWHSISKVAVNPDDVPRFAYHGPSIASRQREAISGLGVLLCWNVAMAGAAYWGFRRCDIH